MAEWGRQQAHGRSGGEKVGVDLLPGYDSGDPAEAPLRVACLALSLSLVASACVDDTEDRAAAEAALDEASVAVQAQTIVGSWVELVNAAPAGSTPEERAEELASAVNKLLDCASATALGTVVDIALAEEGCPVRSRSLWGHVSVDVGGDTDGHTLTWEALTDGGVTLSGTTVTTRAEGDSWAVVDSGTLTLDDDVYRFLDNRVQTPSAGGLRISGARCTVLDSEASSGAALGPSGTCSEVDASGDEGEAGTDWSSVMSAETELTWTEPVPSEGVHQVTVTAGASESRVDLTYTRHSDVSVNVSAAVRYPMLVPAGADNGQPHIAYPADAPPHSMFQFEVIFPL